MPLRILFLGDVVGEAGRKVLKRYLSLVRRALEVDLVIANCENAAGGSGIDPRCYQQLITAGIDAMTMGDHVYKRKEIFGLFEREAAICRPANFPPDAPGPAYLLVETPFGPVATFSLLGRMFMRPTDCPYRAADQMLETLTPKAKIIVVDMHAEATSEKQLMLRHLLGRVSAVFGTHTHVPTADARVYEPGTAYITDVGMTGPYDSIIGRRCDRVLQTTLTFEPTSFDVATGDPRISGALVEIEPSEGRAISVELVHLDVPAMDLLKVPSAVEP